MGEGAKKTLGQAIDEVIAALSSLDEVARATAMKAACEHLGIDHGPALGRGLADAASPPVDSALPAETVPTRSAVRDIRSLKEQKQPKTAVEMACIVAYYLESLAGPDERKVSVTKSDLDKHFKQANFRLPKRMEQVLVDAKNGGYLDSVGRGSYKLNPVGHNLVVHSLPRVKG